LTLPKNQKKQNSTVSGENKKMLTEVQKVELTLPTESSRRDMESDNLLPSVMNKHTSRENIFSKTQSKQWQRSPKPKIEAQKVSNQ
jgi:hypothetical protein